VPTASGVPLQLLPKQINGVRIVGIDVPGFGVPTHAEAKDVLAGGDAELCPQEAENGPVQAPRTGRGTSRRHAAGRDVPRRSDDGIAAMLEPMGLAAGPVVPVREWRELYAALDCAAVAAIHPFYTASIREFEAAGRTGVGSAPVGFDGTAPGCRRSATPATSPRTRIDAAQQRLWRPSRARCRENRIKGRITLSGYEGSELLVARLLVESGADLRLCRHRLPENRMVSRLDARLARSAWRAGRVPRLARAGSAAMEASSSPISPSAPRRSCRRPRSRPFPRSTSPT
jgi:chlorophyllide a reductase subunit Y